MTTLPALRPLAWGEGYYEELRTIEAQIGSAILADIRRSPNPKITLGFVIALSLKYRLKPAAMFALLEDWGNIPAGTYDRIKRSNIGYNDGSTGKFAIMRVLKEYIDTYGLPEAAKGCEV
jgi:hypothetical protein